MERSRANIGAADNLYTRSYDGFCFRLHGEIGEEVEGAFRVKKNSAAKTD